jgi:hypothetical protein
MLGSDVSLSEVEARFEQVGARPSMLQLRNVLESMGCAFEVTRCGPYPELINNCPVIAAFRDDGTGGSGYVVIAPAQVPADLPTVLVFNGGLALLEHMGAEELALQIQPVVLKPRTEAVDVFALVALFLFAFVAAAVGASIRRWSPEIKTSGGRNASMSPSPRGERSNST